MRMKTLGNGFLQCVQSHMRKKYVIIITIFDPGRIWDDTDKEFCDWQRDGKTKQIGEMMMFRDEFKVYAMRQKENGTYLTTIHWIFCVSHGGRHVYCTGRICDVYSWGTILTAAGCTITKRLWRFAFASALSLVVMAGAELFTGNNFVMAAASFIGAGVLGKYCESVGSLLSW